MTKQAEFIDPLALSPAHERKAQQLAQTYAQLGIVTMGFNPTAGKIIYITAVDRAREVLRVARHHPQMMRIVDNIISGNDYVTLILGHVSMVGSILAVQDKLPETPMTVGLKMQGFQSLMAWDAMQTMIAGVNGSNLESSKQYASATA